MGTWDRVGESRRKGRGEGREGGKGHIRKRCHSEIEEENERGVIFKSIKNEYRSPMGGAKKDGVEG